MSSTSTESAVSAPEISYGSSLPGGYLKRAQDNYERALCLIPNDLVDFAIATQPKEWAKLKEHHGDEVRERFVRRVSQEISRRGTLDVLRKGIKDSGCKFQLAFFRPHSGLNEELRRLYEANLFTVVRQLHYSQANENSLDFGVFLNGIPIFTAELKNPLTGQNVEDAVKQYRLDRDPREDLFAFGRCLAHFAVDPDQVFVTTHLNGRKTRFLPFNQGYEGGAGNPPAKTKYATAYLWEQVWAKDSILNLIQHFIHLVQADDGAKKNGGQILLFPRYHQLQAVRGLVAHSRDSGLGQQYLIQHSAGSGKSFTIAWLAHWLSVLHDDDDRRVFDSIIVITDRRILDRQLQKTVHQFEQTLGVVERIDGTSQQLKQALEQGKQIIITTLQKFPVIVEEIGKLGGSQFAIIVDEAHSSQSGESTKALKEVLSAGSLEEAAAEEGDEGEDLEDKIVAEMKMRGRLSNASTFAFTATPKQKTLELFGTPRSDGKFEPFSLYSMRQAIEEGFILDVLENYTTYTTYWKLLKKIEDDPRYDKGKAQYLLKSFVDLHEHAVGQKIDIIVGHFHDQVQHRISGKAKAMVVTRSRLHAVRYKVALDKHLKDKGYPYKVLGAFSGTVRDPDLNADYTESGINGGIPETQTAATFHQPEYRFLVVANKFQTGFDEPMLHTMYVDKPLGGVNAVQTLSRLNRTHPGKTEAMVLDLANEADAIQGAFEPYYEATLLSEGTDPNVLYTLEHELSGFAVYNEAELEAFAQLYFNDAAQEELYAALNPIKERAEQLDEEELQDFRGKLQDYVRLYAFLSQVLTFVDTDLEKLYVFARLLRRYLPAARQELPREIQQKIDMDSYRIQQTSAGKIKLGSGDDLQPPSGGHGHGSRDEILEPLSQIIQELNDRFGVELGPEDRITLERVVQRLHDDESLRLSVETNTEENARLAFETKMTDLLQGLVETNFKLYKRITDDRDFSQHLLRRMFDQYQQRIKDGGATLADIQSEIQAGESKHCEFKSSLRFNLHTVKNDDRMTLASLKSIAAFRNGEGGVLYIGINDEGESVGIEQDGFANEDKFLLHLNNMVTKTMGQAAAAGVTAKVWEIGGHQVCRVACPPSPKPVFVEFHSKESFFVRTGPSTAEMTPSEMHAYIATRFPE